MPAGSVAIPPCTTQAAESGPKNPASSPSSMRRTHSAWPVALPVKADSILERQTVAKVPTPPTLAPDAGRRPTAAGSYCAVAPTAPWHLLRRGTYCAVASVLRARIIQIALVAG